MKTESVGIELLKRIQQSLQQREFQSKGVPEVLARLNHHLSNTSAAIAAKPELPEEHAELLDQSIAGIRDPDLQPIAEQIGLAKNQLSWRIDNGLFYSQQADVGQGYLNGNMHTEFIGPNGCVFEDDEFRLGLFLLAPKTLYRDHAHAAPELYFNLTGPCGWRFNKGEWRDFAAGSLVWNPEGQAHATRTYDQPFLSVYSWTRHVNDLCYVVAADDWQEIEAQLSVSDQEK